VVWGSAGRIPSRLVCETNLPEGRDRKIPTGLNQKAKTKRKTFAMKTPKITAYLKPTCGWSEGVRAILGKSQSALRYHQQSAQLH
jgi:hypothetical protein